MGSLVGAKKNAAAQRGMSVEEYEAKLAGGEKWCSFGKHWVPRKGFHRDASRGDGLTTVCAGCCRTRANGRAGRRRSDDPLGFREKGRTAVKAWRDANPEKQAAITERHRKKYPEKNAAYLRARYAANPALFKEAASRHRELHPEKHIWWRARRRAVARGLPFDLEIEDIRIPVTCPVLGIRLNTTIGSGQSDNSPSIDRLDSSKGYVRGNVYIISMKANRIKNDATVEDLEKVLDYMRRTP